MKPNAQTPGPLHAVPLDLGPRIYAPIPSRGNYAIADALVNDWDQKNPIVSREQAGANARLLAASYTAFDKAGRALGVDAAELAERIDLAALITLSAAMLAQFDKLAIEGKLGKARDLGFDCFAAYETRKVLKALPVVYSPSID